MNKTGQAEIQSRHNAGGSWVLPACTIQHPRIAIFGSADFYHQDSPDLCAQIGRSIARKLPDACVLTGGNSVIQKCISKSFHDAIVESHTMKASRKADPIVFHLVPQGFECDFDFGTCVKAGNSMEERRFILATSAQVCISVEGGPGCADEMTKALNAGKVVIPLVRTGGASSGMFGAPEVNRPECIEEKDWMLLSDKTASIEECANVVATIAKQVFSHHAQHHTTKKKSSTFQNLINNYLGATQKRSPRPTIPDGFDYVSPSLGNSAHKVVDGGTDLDKDSSTQPRGDIYLGPKSSASARMHHHLKEAGIAAIVNCTNVVPCFHDDMKYCQVPVNDECGADIMIYLMGATTFMHALLEEGHSILVHCEVGISRSATVTIAYLMRYQGMRRGEVYLHVKTRRPVISPNQGFWEQLESFESLCTIEKTSTNESPMDLDEKWARESSALYATCRELPHVVEDSECFRRLAKVETLDSVLFVALDFVWGRGILDVDLDWLVFVSQVLDKTHGNLPKPSAMVLKEMMTNEDSQFVEIWSGEIYQPQIDRVLAALESKQ